MQRLREFIESLLHEEKTETRSADLAMILKRFEQLLALSDSRKPFIYQKQNVSSLHFDIWSIQSEMDRDAPHELVLGYTKTMMGFLLFIDDPKKIAMIGLGGGSLPKYCYHYLPETSIVVLENDPEVISLRDHFFIPKDGARFQVLNADGADFLSSVANEFDVLVVDGFERMGQPAQLCSQRFYDDCYRSLTSDGVMAVNLIHDELNNNCICARIRHSFNDAAVVIDADDSMNKIVFACKGEAWNQPDHVVTDRLRDLVCQHTVDLHTTARSIARQSATTR